MCKCTKQGNMGCWLSTMHQWQWQHWLSIIPIEPMNFVQILMITFIFHIFSGRSLSTVLELLLSVLLLILDLKLFVEMFKEVFFNIAAPFLLLQHWCSTIWCKHLRFRPKREEIIPSRPENRFHDEFGCSSTPERPSILSLWRTDKKDEHSFET